MFEREKKDSSVGTVVAHGGSATSDSPEILKALQPILAILVY
ncbi:MAG: hypothetical protein RR533_06000 [Carnobacterium sp.]